LSNQKHSHSNLPLTIAASFLGHAPRSYKLAVVLALVGNVLLWWWAGPVVTGWAIVLEFIATLALALKCYPLAPGGLLAIQALLLGLTTPEHIYAETQHGLPIILLLIFMVTAIAFMQELLVFVFSKALTVIRSQSGLALTFCAVSALLSAFLDALTVIAVVMTVAFGFYRIYFVAASGMANVDDGHLDQDAYLPPALHPDLLQFRAALRGLLMHAAVGTALGGVSTLVGEPQNLLIGHTMGWNFAQFAYQVAPVSIPVVLAGLVTCLLLEQLRWFNFGVPIPPAVREVLLQFERNESQHRTTRDRWRLIIQGVAAVLLVLALGFHWAEVGLIGLGIVIVLTALLGVSEEHQLAEAMKTALPFTALLVVFFAVVAVINDQKLFQPVVLHVLQQEGMAQTAWMYLANGALSAISDNVFVATVYINELKQAFDAGQIAPDQYARLAVAINVGTNIPSVATPNGQAAFLFLLTSAVAPLLRLSYGRMVWMALPYFIVLTITGLLSVMFLLP
jgi:Na+:H+ antiporter, NhaB family